ncbi:MAG: cytochrome c biogenesis protein CcdA [Spirochaetales bacterium]|nr:cytochrome c biogenesis protein CcdA [Spirochaetales bacterium]
MRYTKQLVFSVILVLASAFYLTAQEAIISSSYYVNDKGKGTVLVSYEIPEEFHQIDNRAFFKFSLKENSSFTLNEIVYPPTQSYGNFEGWEGTVVLQASLDNNAGDDLSSPPELEVSYQLCDEQGTCFRPQKINIIPLEGDPSLLPASSSQNPLWLFLLFAFLGGVILNIMPCVLPVLSLKALHLVGQSGDSRQKILINSLLYTAGIIFSMVVLGLIVVGIKASGTALGWGFQFQNPLFVLILTSLVFLFSLSLFEVFFINPPRKAGQAAAAQKGGYGGSFFTGIMAVLLATPCTAPLLGSALGFAFVQTGPVIILFFILIGLGLSLPFILLGFFPTVVNRLPKPGEWMNRFREFMGFLLAGTAIYLLTVLQGQLGSNFGGVLWFLLSLAMGAWLFGLGQRKGRKGRYTFFLVAFLTVTLAYTLFVDLSRQEAVTSESEDFLVFSPEKVDEIRLSGQPLFLEFSADWCATCRSNHLTVLDRDFRRDLFEEYRVVYMKGDYTLNDPVISEWLKKFERAGVPLYVYYEPGKEPQVLPEILNRSIVEKAIKGN